jgi:hypothetical protein
MGTTVVAAWFLPDPEPSMAITHTGDSRAYRIRGTHLEPITADHSLVQQLVTEGHITIRASAGSSEEKRYRQGAWSELSINPDVAIHRLEPEDRFLRCTDGLTKVLPDHEILATILKLKNVPREAWTIPLCCSLPPTSHSHLHSYSGITCSLPDVGNAFSELATRLAQTWPSTWWNHGSEQRHARCHGIAPCIGSTAAHT